MLVNAEVCEQYRQARAPLLCFLHSERTGGNALRTHLLEHQHGAERVYAPRNVHPYKYWRDLTDDDIAGFACYTGHSNFQEVSLTRPYFFITLVRDPMLRAVSLYYLCRRREDHFLWDLATKSSLEEFHIAGVERNPAYFVNVQCNRICGRADARYAMEIIERRYVGVGITEELTTFLVSVASGLGWSPGNVPPRDSLANRRQAEITDELREIISQRDAADVALYSRLTQTVEDRAQGARQGRESRPSEL